jgi:hypothetical protein
VLLEKSSPHWGAGHHRLAARDAWCGRFKPHGNTGAKASQQACDPAGNGIGFVKHHGDPAPSRRHNGWCSDVSTCGEDRINAFPLDQAADAAASGQQLDQLDQFAQSSTLQSTGFDGGEGVAAWDQACFQAVGNAHPTHAPWLRQGIRNGKGRKQVPSGAAGSN